MTKVIILGEEKQPEQKKKIEFVKIIERSGGILMATSTPNNFKNIELISRNYGNYDVMYAYDDDRNKGWLYLGHFNDGEV